MITIPQRDTRQTDRQTDGQTSQSDPPIC